MAIMSKKNTTTNKRRGCVENPVKVAVPGENGTFQEWNVEASVVVWFELLFCCWCW